MTAKEKYMSRCLELAKLGAGYVSPNPMVGCIIVHKDVIIGEGFHKKHGGPHAEVNAINAVIQTELLKESTLYVSLEPCAHHGLTPPCSDLIIEKQILKVVIGSIDPFTKVAGKGIEKLKKARVDVEVGVLENECTELNKRFFTFHNKKRPFVILKWAQTSDGFIDKERVVEDFGEPTWITGKEALLYVHKMRAHEDAIMVGTNTAEKDNPSLTVRHCEGINPVRIVLDKSLRLSKNLNLFDDSVKTIVFNAEKNEEIKNTLYRKINFSENVIPQILNELFIQNVLSVIIEGGRNLLESFISSGTWDEAHVFAGNKNFGSGISAPEITGDVVLSDKMEFDLLNIYKNNSHT